MEREIRNIGFVIKTLDGMIMRRTLDDIPEEGRIPIMQGWLIDYLHKHRKQDIFQKDIEKNFHIARSTVTSLVKQMEQEGYIARVGVKRDSRLKKIVLLEKGEMINNLIKDKLINLEKNMRQDISEKDMEVFFNVAFQILKNLGCNETCAMETGMGCCQNKNGE